jgi:hypothetical protein
MRDHPHSCFPECADLQSLLIPIYRTHFINRKACEDGLDGCSARRDAQQRGRSGVSQGMPCAAEAGMACKPCRGGSAPTISLASKIGSASAKQCFAQPLLHPFVSGAMPQCAVQAIFPEGFSQNRRWTALRSLRICIAIRRLAPLQGAYRLASRYCCAGGRRAVRFSCFALASNDSG